MTQEQVKELLPVLQAFAEGKTIEYRSVGCGGWYEASRGLKLGFENGPENYRIKSEPKLRPWTLDEIPVGAQVRRKGSSELRRLILSNAGGYIQINVHDSITCSFALEAFEVSTDQGKAWGPCGVYENS